jgi:transcription initiation factor IIE alpha subunit
MSTSPQSLLEDLVRYVARAFYSPTHIVLLDALVRHPYIKDEELASKLGLPQKSTRKELSELKKDCLVQCETRSEKQQSGHSHQFLYWFIDYKMFIESVIYRLFKMEKIVKESAQKDVQYVCTNKECRAEYNDFDVLNILNPEDNNSMICQYCKSEVVEHQSDTSEKGGLEGLLKEQIKPIQEILNKLVKEYTINIGGRRNAKTAILSNQEVLQRKLEEQREKKMEAKLGGHAKFTSIGGMEAVTGLGDKKLDVEISLKDKPEEKKTLSTRDQDLPFWLRRTSTEQYQSLPESTMMQQSSTLVQEEEDEEMEKVEQISTDQSIPVPMASPTEDVYNQLAKEFVETTSEQKLMSSPTGDGDEWKSATEELSHVMVKVAGQLIPLTEVTEEHQEKMSVEEYKAYAAALQEHQIL